MLMPPALTTSLSIVDACKATKQRATACKAIRKRVNATES
jgi:hypothetical protein